MRAFSLIELLIVIAIIAVLASLGIPQYRKFIYKSKVTEVKTILPTIMQLQEMYIAEKNKYITCGFYPSRAVGGTKASWEDGNCISSNLNFNAKGGTFCQYAIASGDYSTNPASASPSDSVEVEQTPGVDITAIAKCDIDGDGKFSFYTLTDESTDIKGPFNDDF
ncbi:MAG: prepilin-type N-terminal cleavage/methylation domain-containing protein [bacterium]|nr:prepilin-type N-terminal cleavage/methylation domain-containing protein [bacterium]